MTFIKTNFFALVLLGLCLLYFFTDTLDGIKPQPPKVTIQRDTVWTVSAQTIPQYQPVIISSTPPTVLPPQYAPDTTYRGVLRQYQSLLNQYLSRNTVRDTIKLDSIGYVAIEDTVSENRIVSRKPSYSYRIPVITSTITVHEAYKPRNQVYLGGGLLLGPQLQPQGLEAGLLFKNKKDRIFGIKGQYSFSTGVGLGAQAYWKINLK